MMYFSFLFIVDILVAACLLFIGLTVPTPFELEEKTYEEPIELKRAA